MTDIVERIKDAENATHALFNHIFQDAREEIERLRIENEALRAEVIHIKEVDFPRKAQAVADSWRGKCERLEAKIADVGRQELVGVLHVGSCYGEELQDWEFEADQRVCDRLNEQHVTNPTSLNLYALSGAQPYLNEIKTALQRALELGARETWTGARKHRSWEDQREEQQCWNKVWSLLGAQTQGDSNVATD